MEKCKFAPSPMPLALVMGLFLCFLVKWLSHSESDCREFLTVRKQVTSTADFSFGSVDLRDEYSGRSYVNSRTSYVIDYK